MAVLPTDYTDSTTPTGATTEYPATTARGLNATHTQINTNTTDLSAKASLTGTETLTNKTLTAPKINYVADTNGNVAIGFVTTPAAVNFLNCVNGAAGAGPYFVAAGADTDVNLLFYSKGAGKFYINNVEVTDVSGAQTLTNKTLTSPKVNQLLDANGNELIIFPTVASAVNQLSILNNVTGQTPLIQASGDDTNIGISFVTKGTGNFNMYDGSYNVLFATGAAASGVNYPLVQNAATGADPFFGVYGSDANVNLNLTTKGTGVVKANTVEVVTISGTQTLTGKTLTSPVINTPSFPGGIGAADIPSGITNGNTALQSQAVVSATNYYIAGSNLNLPNPLKSGMVVGTRFRWTVAMAKSAAGTGIFQISIYRGTNGSTADTQDVLQTIGTQTAVVDNMTVDVELVVTTTGATGAYYWTIIPTNKAITATGFGVATGPTGQFSGTVSSVAMNTAALKFGLGFKATTGTPTITIPLVRAQALNIS